MAREARSPRRWLAIALAAAAFGLALIGIHGQSASAEETARASRASTVTIAHFEFRPATIAIARGSKVRFANNSGIAHTASRRGSFDTGRIKPSKSASVQFSQRGTFAYHCKIHPSMKGKIVVD
jgi:plastocyanin